MSFDNARKFDRRIALAIILLLIAIACGSSDSFFYDFESGNGLTNHGSTVLSRSWFDCSISAISNNAGEHAAREELDESTSDLEILKAGRRSQGITGGITLSASVIRFRSFFYSACSSLCAFLFLLIQLRFIHSQDGSK